MKDGKKIASMPQKTMKRLTPEERYKYNLRKQQKTLEEFAEHEIEWADDLMLWYKCKKIDMPEDEYRACSYFLNREFRHKAGSLTLLYKVYLICESELTEATKETAFDQLRYRYMVYAKTLEKGGF
jgi:hypothetical protein